MPPKHHHGHRRDQQPPAAVGTGKDAHAGKGNNSYASVVVTNTNAKKGGNNHNNVASTDLTASTPDELQAQMNRLLSEVDRVRTALEQRKATPAASSPDDEDEEVLRLRYENNAASVSMDEDQLQTLNKKPRGYSPTTTNAVAKAFGQHEASANTPTEKRGGSPLMDQQAWLQKMLRQMPGGAAPQGQQAPPPAPRAFQSPPPLPAAGPKAIASGHNPHDISALSTVNPDTSTLSEQDQMWGGNGDREQGPMWQHQLQHGAGGRGRGGAVYTNPHRTGTMSYRQNHHHDSTGDSRPRRGGGGFNSGLFSEDGGRYNEYVTTKDYVVVEFKRERTKKYPCATKVQPGEYVIVDGDRGQDCGLVIQVAYAKEDGTFEVQCIDAMLKNYVRTKPERARVLRVATPEEVSFLHSDIDAMEKAALQTCKAKCDELGITDLKLVDCEFQFDRQKVSFFFDSERSIDFRALVRDLHRAFGIRIWMENINPGVKNSVPADAQADIMWTGEDTAQQRLLGGLGMGVGGSTMMMMSAAPMPTQSHQNQGPGGYSRGRGGGGRGGAMRR